MLDVSRDDIVDGSLSRALVLVAVPLVAQNYVRVAEAIIDTLWLGRIGEGAVAALGLIFPVTALLHAFGTVAPLAATRIIVSQRYGGDDVTGARRIAFHGVVLAAVLAGAVAIGTALVARPFLALFDPGAEVLALATTYLTVYALGLPIMAVSDALESAFTGWGDTRATLWVNVVTVVANLVADPFLIFGWGPFPALGIFGAALATVVSWTVGLLFITWLTFGPRDSFTLTRDAVAFDLDEIRELLDVGAPVAGQWAVSQTVRLLIVAVVSLVGGAPALAAYNVGGRIASAAFTPAQGLKDAATTVIGQNLGADHPDRARRTTWLGVAIAVAGTGLIGVVQFLFPAAIATLVIPDVGETTLALTVDYLRILAFGYWGIGAGYIFLAGFDGARHTRISLVVDLLKYWAVRLPIAAVGAFVLDWGVHAVFWAVTVSNVVAAVGAGLYYVHSTRDGMLERAADVATAD